MMFRVGIHVASFPMEVYDVLLGTLGASLGRFFLHKETELTLDYFGKLFRNQFLQAFQVWGSRFRLFGTFILDNENAGGSAKCIHKDFSVDDAFVTHMITCQGRDHIVNVQSGQEKSCDCQRPFRT